MDVKAKISWDELFMGIAALSAMRSKDPSTINGVCIVNKENRIVSIGYNGMPLGDDENFTWSREPVDGFSKYDFVIHAEGNGILNAPDRQSLKDATMFLYSEKLYLPCNECMKLVVQSGIKEIVLAGIIDENTDKYNWKPTLYMAEKSGISIRDIGRDASFDSFNRMSEEFKIAAMKLLK